MNHLIRSQLFGTLGVESAEIDEATSVVAEDIQEEPVEAESSVAEAIEGVGDDEEITAIEEQGEDLDDATEGLEELDAAVESYQGSGKSLTPIEAAALNLTLRQTVSRFVKDTGDLVPAAENFNTDGVYSTTLACEGIKDAAKSFGEGVVAAAKKAWEKLKEIVAAIVNRFRSIEARADRVIVRAKEAKGLAAGEIEFSKDKISVGGAADGQILKDGLSRMRNSLEALVGAPKSEEALKILEEINGGDKTQKVSSKAVFEGYNKFMEQSFRKIFGDLTEKDGKLTAKPFPGEWTPELVKATDETIMSYDSLERVKPKEKGGDVKIDAVNPQEAIELAGMVKVVQKSISNFKGWINRQDSIMKRMNSVGITDENRVKSTKDTRDEMGVGIIKANKVVWNVMRRESVFFTRLVSAVNQISLNTLELCEKSLKMTSEENKAKDGDANEKQLPANT